MLTDSYNNIQAGKLDPDIHLPATAKLEILNFIAAELPRWRDHPDRPLASAETTLTDHLCTHLNGATRTSAAWSHLQFRTETDDETCGGRKIDLAVRPCGVAFIVENRRCTQFETLFPIECKRLPTPKGKDRDEREYVISRYKTTGGIQRFKLGYHGASHSFAAMIAYVQEQSFSEWLDQVNGWIQILATDPNSPWTIGDKLQSLNDDLANGVATFKSEHSRKNGLGCCKLHHLWVKMEPHS